MKISFERVIQTGEDFLTFYFNLMNSSNKNVRRFFRDVRDIVIFDYPDISESSPLYKGFINGRFSRYSYVKQFLWKETKENNQSGLISIGYNKERINMSKDCREGNMFANYLDFFYNISIHFHDMGNAELLEESLMKLDYLKKGDNFSKANPTGILKYIKKGIILPGKENLS